MPDCDINAASSLGLPANTSRVNMSRRSSRQRRQARKERSLAQHGARAAEHREYVERVERMIEADTPLSSEVRARTLQRFSTLRGRGVVLRFNFVGPLVEARTPEELRANTERALVEGRSDSGAGAELSHPDPPIA